jgi:hypothetical protein
MGRLLSASGDSVANVVDSANQSLLHAAWSANLSRLPWPHTHVRLNPCVSRRNLAGVGVTAQLPTSCNQRYLLGHHCLDFVDTALDAYADYFVELSVCSFNIRPILVSCLIGVCIGYVHLSSLLSARRDSSAIVMTLDILLWRHLFVDTQTITGIMRVGPKWPAST